MPEVGRDESEAQETPLLPHKHQQETGAGHAYQRGDYAAAATSAVHVQKPPRQLWAVQIVGGKAAADAVAQQHGFANAGPIGTLADHYHFHGRPASATGAAVHVASASVSVAVSFFLCLSLWRVL